jgi:voltage-gated potassium channel
MTRLLEGLDNHVIVCGAGATGTHILRELHESRTPFVVVDVDSTRIDRVAADLGPELLYVTGDATDDQVLEEAGIRRARGLIAALHDDRDNLFITVTARALSDTVRIVAKAVEYDNIVKIKRAGADSVVAPAYIGGQRMASEMVRPSVVQFLDAMVRDREQMRRIEEVLITAESPMVGRSLVEARIREVVDALVIAVRYLDGHHEYNPGPDLKLRAGMVLIALVRTDEVVRLKEHINGPGVVRSGS